MRPARFCPAILRLSLACAAVVAAAFSSAPSRAAGPLQLTLRWRAEAPDHGGACRVVEKAATWEPAETAIIVCDMWDLHHCLNAVRRENQLAPRMDAVIKAARGRGVTIIHAPSECMAAYEGHPARDRALAVPKSQNQPADIGSWCKRVPPEEQGKYPVDQTDGGEDDDPAEHARWAARLTAMGRNPRAPWVKQTDVIDIDPGRDYVSDKGDEVWAVLETKGIRNVVLMGVHTNMCVLGRPFGLRQMAKNGKNVVLMRDMTDTMYNPKRPPFVNHFTGNDLVVEHIERYVCPTVTSDQVVGGTPFRYGDDTRPRVAFLVAEDEYKTEATLPPFAATQLGKDFKVAFVFDRDDDKNVLTGTGALDEADVLVVSARRRLFPEKQLASVRRHVAAGKAVVGLRTASHAFAARANTPTPAGHDAWPEFDADVLGGHYTGHLDPGPKSVVRPSPDAPGHPLLKGVDAAKLSGSGTLYKASPLAPSATPLLTGEVPDKPAEPVLWTNLTASGGRVVYTSLGHPDDFNEPEFVALLRNAVYYAAGLGVPTAFEPSSTQPIAFP